MRRKKLDTFKNWPLIENPHFCPIFMKHSENNQNLRQSFSPSFIRITQKMWIFYYISIFQCVSFFLPQTLQSNVALMNFLELRKNNEPYPRLVTSPLNSEAKNQFLFVFYVQLLWPKIEFSNGTFTIDYFSQLKPIFFSKNSQPSLLTMIITM